MNKDELFDLILSERKKGFIVFQTIEGLQKCELSKFVQQPIEGQLYDLNRDMATCLSFLDEPTWINNLSCNTLLTYYYERCKELENKLEEYAKKEEK